MARRAAASLREAALPATKRMTAPHAVIDKETRPARGASSFSRRRSGVPAPFVR
jgi:hypothetical protein